MRSIPQLLKITEDDWDNDSINGTLDELKKGLV
jgi:hypothetical protein